MASPHDYLERCDRLAVMGGTFDPIHRGHMTVAESVMHEFKPRRVLFVPAGNPPHKPGKPITDGEHRYKMTLAATCENPGFEVSRMEIDRTGPSYTVDTLTRLREICPPESKIFFIIGADALLDILFWRDAAKALTLCEFVVAARPGYELKNHIEMLRKEYGATVHIVESLQLEISGTDIRERFAADKPVSNLMPRAAEDYARKHGLYGAFGAEFSPTHFQWVKARLKERLSPQRFHHTMGTIEESQRLAEIYGADANKAMWAALLHDCAKEYGADKKRILCKRWGIPLDDIMSRHIDLAHGFLGAESARRDFNIEDSEILQAIRYHSLGHKNMTLLDKIIMLADYIEPRREEYPPLAEMRRLAYTDINKALIIGTKFTNSELKDRGDSVHPWSLEMLKELKST
ncbi:MAG: nicotinate-nucleotide adenylyltransferase [Defluviitaleaceae bacterium]|nr:nicotinate-nucleotide adenylyltransferase [Defluviitaleaceae bacterium]